MKYLFLLITLILSISLNAQNPQWVNYSSGVWVNCVCPQGQFIWAGTNGGLVKINTSNNETTFFNRGNSGLPDNKINSIAVDGLGNKWIATDAGVTMYNDIDFMHYDTSTSFIPGNVVNSIYATDNSETIFICTNKGYVKSGLYWSTIDTSNSELPDNDVKIIRYDNDDVLWIGTKNGLARKDINNWTIYNTSNSLLQGNQISALAVDHENVIWAGTRQIGGLNSFNGSEWTYWGDIHYELSNQIPVIFVDNNNKKWMGTPHEGVMILDGNDLTLWNFGSGIPSVYIHDITQNENGDMYIASGFGGGLLKFQNDNWSIIESSNTAFLSFSNRIQSVAVSPNNSVFFGVTNHGLTEFNSNTWTNYDIYGDYLFSIHTTNNEVTWLGTENCLAKLENGFITNIGSEPVYIINSEDDNTLWYSNYYSISMVNGDEFNWYTAGNSGILPHPYTDIAIDKNNKKWIASYFEGLSSFDDLVWENYTLENSEIPFDRIKTVAIDTNNNIWIGGWGIAKYDGIEWEYFSSDNSSLVDNHVDFLVFDDQNKLWIGTEESGMMSFDGNVWELFNVHNSGIPYNKINQIDIDLYNNKWIATPRGLGVYNKDGVILNMQKYKVRINEFIAKPNPANDYFYLQPQQETNKEYQIRIYNMKGQLIKSIPHINLNEKISTHNLENSLYIIEIQTGNKSGFAKLLIQKH